MGSFLYEKYWKLSMMRINSADLVSQNGQDSICVKDMWLKYEYVDSSFYKKSLLIYIKSV